ncbi:hypothetical protein [Deinococcus sp.]|uniref:hypothetical protein n=1 Tax=Deinococcus sp. TaxID=47478 RepID=UPI0025D3A50B|nr:hypothetical protein [Deinococcus sp.]
MNPRTILLTGAALLGAGLVSNRTLAQSTAPASAAPRFPNVTSKNLEGRTFNLPGDFGGRVNLVALAFLREHQDLVDTWGPAVSRLTGQYPGFKFYELPTLTRGNGLARLFIDGGMRAGIPSKATRDVTITLYLDRATFMRSIGERDMSTIHLLLVGQQGEILWKGRGAATPAQEASLRAVLDGLH